MWRAWVTVKLAVSEIVKLAVMISSPLKAGAEQFLPVINGFLLGWRRQRRIDGVAGIQRRFDDGVRFALRIEAADVVGRVDGIDDLDGIGECRDFGAVIIV